MTQFELRQKVFVTFTEKVTVYNPREILLASFAPGEVIDAYFIEHRHGWYQLDSFVGNSWERVGFCDTSVTVSPIALVLPPHVRKALEESWLVVSQLVTEANLEEHLYAVWSRDTFFYPTVQVEGTTSSWDEATQLVEQLESRLQNLKDWNLEFWITTQYPSCYYPDELKRQNY